MTLAKNLLLDRFQSVGGPIAVSAPILVGQEAPSDLNGDGRSDVLWRNDNGQLIDWLGTASGSFDQVGNLNWNLSVSFMVAGTADFDGDGRADFVTWHNNLHFFLIDMNTSAGLVPDWDHAAAPPSNWQIVGVGDFNGDNKSDILWRQDAGWVSVSFGDGSGDFIHHFDSGAILAGSDWQIQGVGDFNGDGKDDILWRNSDGWITDWLGTDTGAFVGNLQNAAIKEAGNWQVAGVGDFNGDGKSDILWRNADGWVTEWLGTDTGSFTGNWTNAHVLETLDWHVAGVGDYNGDHIDDVLWRNDNGTVTDWLGTATGAFVGNWNNAAFGIGPDWHAQPHHDLV